MIRTNKGKRIMLWAAFAVLAAMLWTNSGYRANAQKEANAAHIELEQTTLTVKAWRNDGSHLMAIKGKLSYEEHPVANALLVTEPAGKSILTDKEGVFELIVDRSLITRKPVRVASLDEARIDGEPVTEEAAELLLAVSDAISVYHPIEVTKVEPLLSDGSRVKVHARIMSESEDRISYFRADKYRIAGSVEDADGKPVKNAIVWIDRDQGEGFAKSTPTDEFGNYEMYYWPEEEDTNLTVIAGTRQYALPAGKVLILPRHTSVNIRIRLPRAGSIIEDKPPMLICTTSKGATYSGLMAGLDVPAGTPYSLTIPDEAGRFVLTVPKDAWEKGPLFFETLLTKFVERDKVLKAGDELPVDFVQGKEHDPRIEATPH
ncbi:carboxypeptidase-like regulatory domain-containing protein [Paenibacillus sp. HB172176]|uniref:carboxypeptidase-like regulatory domain-containing protein n=1 Tax=Paenibacillus sp. HB172176 TaxID=2493690 RepID=UPI001439DF3E|nr:carboxypeptidase-like regulatory domain-containing protein [Paenibacillus sp. HB172176]